MKTRPYLLQALTPLHAGTGQSVGVLDLPIARMRATGIPFLPGSSLKGVLREQMRARHEDEGRMAAVFGPARHKDKRGAVGDDPSDLDHAGALVVGDARLLALPVRSFFGTFALVTSPLLLTLARRDLGPRAPARFEPPREAPAGKPHACYGPEAHVNLHRGRVYLEELDLPAHRSGQMDAWAEALLHPLPAEEQALLRQRLLVVDDETMSFLWETATQVDTRVRLDSTTGTVAKGALWTEESLPAETLLVGVLAASPSLRDGMPLTAEEVLEAVRPAGDGWTLQLGGKATVGRGRCRLLAWT